MDFLAVIPTPWAEEKGWTQTIGNTKQPVIPANNAKSAYTLAEVAAIPTGKCNLGFITSELNNIVILDIDNSTLENLPAALQTAISKTYSEYSLSGNGLHIVFTTDKSKLPNKAYLKTKVFEGQLSIKNNFMVVTGNKLPQSPQEIFAIPAEMLLEILQYEWKKPKESAVDTGTNDIDNMDTPPIFAKFKKAVMSIPIDQCDRVKRVYEQEFNQKYEHYNFWLTIGMAIHDYGKRVGQMTQALELYLNWSVLDPTDFESDEAVANKWASFASTQTSRITYKTVLKLAQVFEFNYPKKVFDKKARKYTSNPIIIEYDNFEYLLDKYNIKLCHMNNLTLFIKGDEDIVKKYFMLDQIQNLFGYYGPFNKTKLYAATLRLCQDSLWQGLSNTKNLVDIWVEQPKVQVDLFNEWLNWPSHTLSNDLKFPRNTGTHIDTPLTTFEDLEACIDWDITGGEEQLKLYKKMLYATFMQLIKLHEPGLQQFEDNGGMFAFIGPENTYKTTFFKLLLPIPLEFLRKEQNQELVGEKNKRDFVRNLSSAVILLVDEFEGFMDHKHSGSFFKSIISSNTTSFTDIYKTEESSLKRKAILVGTSNDLKQIISDNGSRRLWYTKIRSIDTTRMLQIDLHAMYNNMRDRFRKAVAKGETPWLLTKEEVTLVSENNKEMRAKSSLDLNLEEIFPYTTNYNVESRYKDREILVPTQIVSHLMPEKDKEGDLGVKRGRFLKTQHVVKLLKFYDYPIPPTAELNRALMRFCMDFIGQRSRTLAYGKMAIESGQLCVTKHGNKWMHRLWILPIDEDYKPEEID